MRDHLVTVEFPAETKRVEAGLLNVGYAEAGPTDGEPVMSWLCLGYVLATARTKTLIGSSMRRIGSRR
jgi:hypothetical protein